MLSEELKFGKKFPRINILVHQLCNQTDRSGDFSDLLLLSYFATKSSKNLYFHMLNPFKATEVQLFFFFFSKLNNLYDGLAHTLNFLI